MLLDRARGLGQRSRFLVLTKRSTASGDENTFEQVLCDILEYNKDLTETIILQYFTVNMIKFSFLLKVYHGRILSEYYNPQHKILLTPYYF